MDFNLRKSTTWLVFLVLLLDAGSAATPTAVDIPTRSYAITNVAIVDVERGSVIAGQTVIVAGGRIDKIGAQGELSIPPEVELIDGQGLYLMPGLVDAHVHYQDAPVFGRAKDLAQQPAQ